MGVRTCAEAGFLSKLFFWWVNDLLCLGYHHKLQTSDLKDQLLESDSSKLLSAAACQLWDEQHDGLCPWEQHMDKEPLKGNSESHSESESRSQDSVSSLKRPRGHRSLFYVIRKQFGWRYAALGLLPFVEECGLRIIQPVLIGILMEKLADTDSQGPPYLEAVLIVLCSVLSVFTTHWFYFSVQHIGMRVRIVCSSLIYRKCLQLQPRLGNSEPAKASVSPKKVKPTAGQGKLLNLLSSDVQRFDQSCVSLHYLWIAPCNLAIVFTILYREYGWYALAGLGLLLGFTALQAALGVQFARFRTRTAAQTDARLEFLAGMLRRMKQIKMLGLEELYRETCRKLRAAEMRMIRRTAWLRVVNLTFFYAGIKVVFFILVWWTSTSADGPRSAPALFVTLALFNNIRNLITSYLPNGILQLAEARVAMRRIEKYLNSSSHEADNPSNQYSVQVHGQVQEKEENLPYLRFSNVPLHCREEEPLTLEVQPGEVVQIVGGVGTGKTTLLQAVLNEKLLPSGRITYRGRIAYCPQTPWIYPAPMRDNIILNAAYDPERYDRVLRACALNNLGHVSMESLSGGMRARVSLARAAYSDAEIYLLDDPFASLDKTTKTHIIKELVNKWLVARGKVVVICGGDGSIGRTISLDGVNMERRRSVAGSLEGAQPNAEEEDQRVEMVDELGRNGGVSWKTLFKYFASGCGPLGAVVLILVNLLTQASFTGTDYYLKVWTSDHASTDELSISMSIFGALTGTVVLASIVRTLLFFRACLRASVRIHERIFDKVVTSKLEFFHSHGKILNRFSKDMTLMDESLPTTFFSAAGVLLQVLGTVVLISVLQPWSLIPALALSAIFYTLRRFYIRTGCAIRRFEALGLSPLYTLVSSTAAASGLSTIRCYGAQQRFLEEFHARLDRHSASWYVNLAASRWFGIWLDWISVLYTAIVVGSFVVGATVAADADAGLAITSVLFLAGTFQLGARQSADAENQLVAVERIFEYEKLDVEDFKSGRDDIKVDAPVEFKHVQVIYEDNNHVLSDISFKIGRGEKVALLGRTGCGKTTLLKALYRLCDYTGTITFDGVDAQDIRLGRLRSSVSVIPQEPYLFRGTVRDNLDPTSQMTDDEICRVFNRFSAFFNGIYSEVEEDGHNLSQGQKQILSLVRVMLKGSRILVLDEPTANLDSSMDELIKQSLTEFCSNCTVITVAHRLATVAHYDRAFTLRNGVLKETVLSRTK